MSALRDKRGRVLYIDQSSRKLQLQYQRSEGFLFQQTYNIETSLPKNLKAGDWVCLRLEGHSIVDAEVLTPYKRSIPFPSPGADYYRLQQSEQTRHALLVKRARILSEIRDFFSLKNYIEIEAPLRVKSPGLEPHLLAEPCGSHYLITSPEYQLKRLLSAGFERIYSLGKCFRQEECGPHHLVEFSMLEWYQAYLSYEGLMDQTEELIHTIDQRLGFECLKGKAIKRLAVCDAIKRFSGVDIAGVVDAEELKTRIKNTLGDISDNLSSYEELLALLFIEKVEPELKNFPAIILYDYPAPVAALSALKEDDPTLAQRFEVYLNGIELANAFYELRDPDEQRERFKADNRRRKILNKPQYPIDEKLIEALKEGMPPCAGIALGVDRLVAALLKQNEIRSVIPFAEDEL